MRKSFRRLLALPGVGLAVLFFAAAGASSQVAPLATSASDYAIGDFERANGGHVGFEAFSDPDGANPFGHLSSTIDNDASGGTGTIKSRYDVVCLAVSGNEASIGLVPTDSPPDNAGTPRVLTVLDSGLPGGAGDMYAFVLQKNAPANCAKWLGRYQFAPLSGDIVVHDEP
jgi:hypothetical protein